MLPSKATQSMPNLQKQNNSGDVINASVRRTLPLCENPDHSELSVSNKRHSLTNMEQRSLSFTATRRASLTVTGRMF